MSLYDNSFLPRPVRRLTPLIDQETVSKSMLPESLSIRHELLLGNKLSAVFSATKLSHKCGEYDMKPQE